MPSSDGGLGTALVGERVSVNDVHLSVTKLLGEGGFAYVYLVKDIGDIGDGKNGVDSKKSVKSAKSKDKEASKSTTAAGTSTGTTTADGNDQKQMVLKITSIFSKQQRDIAENEARLLSEISHKNIIKIYDSCYRTVPSTVASSSKFGRKVERPHKDTTQHLILMEFCEGGHAMSVCTQLRERNQKFDLSSLIIAFGHICNAVSYLHAQRPPIVHRDLKPENFLIKNGLYKLCDFGSSIVGNVELKTPQDRSDAEEVIQKTTTQMFRAPEMVDIYMAKRLTPATDVWALGCCLYSLAFLQNCFEEGSNLAILSRKYKIPDENPYGEGLVELIDRMLTIDAKARADMTEVILCLSAVFSNRPLPPRDKRSKKKKEEDGGEEKNSSKEKEKKDRKKPSSSKSGIFRTDGQGVTTDNLVIDAKAVKTKEIKKLDPNSAAARRRLAAASGAGENSSSLNDFTPFDDQFDKTRTLKSVGSNGSEDLAFSTTNNPFATGGVDDPNVTKNTVRRMIAVPRMAGASSEWTNSKDGGLEAAFNALSMANSHSSSSRPNSSSNTVATIASRGRSKKETRDPMKRSRSKDLRRATRRPSTKKIDSNDDSTHNNGDDDDDDDDNDDHNNNNPLDDEHNNNNNESQLLNEQGKTAVPPPTNATVVKVIKSRGVRRMASGGQGLQRSRSRGPTLRRSNSQTSRKKGGSTSNRSGEDHSNNTDNDNNDDNDDDNDDDDNDDE